MGIQAFDEKGRKIPFAIYDTDYTVDDGAPSVPAKDALGYTPLVAFPENPIPVEVSVTNINERGVFLTVKRFGVGEPTTLGFGMTPDEVFAHDNWIVVGYTHHFDEPVEAVAFKDPRKPFDDLKAIDKEIAALRDEESMSGPARYKELSGPHGLVRLTECRRNVLRLVAQVTILSLTGMWPRELDRLGL